MERQKISLKDALLKHFYANAEEHDSYWIMRDVFVRGLGLIYLNVFAIFYFQGPGLFAKQGLTPISDYIARVQEHYGSASESFWQLPTLFHFLPAEGTLTWLPLLGIVLSLILVSGRANFPLLFILWAFQLSIQNAGQIFYSYGWESQLLELTFLSFFLCPLWRTNLYTPASPPKKIAILFQRWMLFRLMLGAGLIKIRGDECWRDLTCTYFHYETQPNPHPLSWYLHHLPELVHQAEVLFNHFAELIIPFALFGPKVLRRTAGVLTIAFQVSLIISGNLSWLNWLTILMTIPCFDDQFLRKLSKIFSRGWFFKNKASPQNVSAPPLALMTLVIFTVFGLFHSYQPALNLLSSRQRMNTSFSQFHFINSYGAFGSITKKRNEIIIKGTRAKNPSESDWKEYEFKCKPGDLSRAPCLITPYHYRLDWQIWFSAMRPKLSERWLANLAYHLLLNSENVTDLIEKNPFKERPPRAIKMDLYRYEFTSPGSENWWKREFVKPYMAPMTKNRLKEILR